MVQCRYLRSMYQVLHPAKALPPQTASPPEYARAIEMSFGSNLDSPQDCAELVSPRGTKRKRADADQDEEYRLTRRRLGGVDDAAPALSPVPSPEWAFFPQSPAGEWIDNMDWGVPDNDNTAPTDANDIHGQKTYGEDRLADSERRHGSQGGCGESNGSGSSGSATPSVVESMEDALFVGPAEATAGADFDRLLHATTEYSDLLDEWPSSPSVESAEDGKHRTNSAHSTPTTPLGNPTNIEDCIDPGSASQSSPPPDGRSQSPDATAAQEPFQTSSELNPAAIDELVRSWRVPENLEQAIAETFPCPAPLEPEAAPQFSLDQDPRPGPAGERDPACSPAGIHEIRDLRNRALRQVQDRVQVPLYGHVLAVSDVERLFDEIANIRPITEFTINLVCDKLNRTHPAPGVWVGHVAWEQQAPDGGLPRDSTHETFLLPTGTPGQWSLVEVDAVRGSIVHHRFAAARSDEASTATCQPHLPCASCRLAADALTVSLRESSMRCPEWHFESSALHCRAADGIALLWALEQRAGGGSLDAGPPADFGRRLAESIVTEMCRRGDPLTPPTESEDRSPQLKARQRWQRWSSFQSRSDRPTSLVGTWEAMAGMPIANAPIGWDAADRLMRMVFNIASPAVLLGIKHQLRHLRTGLSAVPGAFTRNAAGAFAAGMWHDTNEHASRVGLVLSYWAIHDHRQRRQQEGYPDAVGQTVDDIVSQLPHPQPDRGQVVEKVKEWSRRAWPWNQLVRIAGSPNILCFLPQGVRLFPGEDEWRMTDYRRLKKAQFDLMERVFREHRALLLRSVPADFFEVFLYRRLPGTRFAIEGWSDDEILREPLDSAKFDHAFEPVSVS